ncbi:MAG: hypothetical protein EB084_02600 [Proteobacteria bacterium]|nr:hypothetical protein [Pseudomonadota bacterium]
MNAMDVSVKPQEKIVERNGKGGSKLMKRLHLVLMMTCFVTAWVLLRTAAGYADVIMAKDQPIDLFGTSSKVVVGDMLTVVLSETVTVDTAVTSTKKRQSTWKTSAGAGLLTFIPGFEKNGSSSTDDSDTNKQAQTITSQMTVRVTAIEPNGNLQVEGSRILWGNGRKVSMSLKGIARQVDINPDNSISSQRLLNLAVRVDGMNSSKPFDVVRTVVGSTPQQ